MYPFSHPPPPVHKITITIPKYCVCHEEALILCRKGASLGPGMDFYNFNIRLTRESRQRLIDLGQHSVQHRRGCRWRGHAAVGAPDAGRRGLALLMPWMPGFGTRVLPLWVRLSLHLPEICISCSMYGIGCIETKNLWSKYTFKNAVQTLSNSPLCATSDGPSGNLIST